jgi:hypothetical protein
VDEAKKTNLFLSDPSLSSVNRNFNFSLEILLGFGPFWGRDHPSCWFIDGHDLTILIEDGH